MKRIFYIAIILFTLIQTAFTDENLVSKTNTKSLKEGVARTLFYHSFENPAYQRYLNRECDKLDNTGTPLIWVLREECFLYELKKAQDSIQEIIDASKFRAEMSEDDFVMNVLH